MSAIGQRVQEARLAKGWSRQELDDEADLAKGHTSMIESGKRSRLEAATLSRLADALGVSLSWLIDGPSPNATVTSRNNRARRTRVKGAREQRGAS